jgi:hypothetical protein
LLIERIYHDDPDGRRRALRRLLSMATQPQPDHADQGSGSGDFDPDGLALAIRTPATNGFRRGAPEATDGEVRVSDQ